MRTETVEVTYYTFDELSDKAKQAAITWWREGGEYPWYHDNMESLKGFDQIFTDFDAEDLEGAEAVNYLQNLANNGELLVGNCPFTGYYMDEVLLDPIREFIVKPQGTYRELIDTCLSRYLDSVKKDEEYYFSDESAAENILGNGYEFDVNGDFLC